MFGFDPGLNLHSNKKKSFHLLSWTFWDYLCAFLKCTCRRKKLSTQYLAVVAVSRRIVGVGLCGQCDFQALTLAEWFKGN